MPRRRPLVLYIFGDKTQAPAHTSLLEHDQYDVIAVASREGLQALRNNAIDPIVLDAAGHPSPGSVVGLMKTLKPHVPVVLVVHGSASVCPSKYGKPDAILLSEDASLCLLRVLDHLLNFRFTFFTRWFGNWRYRVGA